MNKETLVFPDFPKKLGYTHDRHYSPTHDTYKTNNVAITIYATGTIRIAIKGQKQFFRSYMDNQELIDLFCNPIEWAIEYHKGKEVKE